MNPLSASLKRNWSYVREQSSFQITVGSEREATGIKLKRLKALVNIQQKLRVKRKQVIKEIARDHPERGFKLKMLKVKKTPWQPNTASQIEGLHVTVLSIAASESTAD